MLASWSKLSEKFKNDIKILVGQVVLELLIKTLFLHVMIKNPWAYYNFDAIFKFLIWSASR